MLDNGIKWRITLIQVSVACESDKKNYPSIFNFTPYLIASLLNMTLWITNTLQILYST